MSSGDDTEESEFFFMEIWVLKTPGGNIYLNRSYRGQKRAEF